MTTLTKIIVSIVMALLLVSCNFDMNLGPGISGNGNVTTETRDLDASFIGIKASEGLDVYLTQGNSESIKVQADENLHEIILTEIRNGVLHIHTSENIRRSSAQKVMVQFDDIENITSTSGSDVYSTNTIKADRLELKSTSGSDMELDIDANSIICNSTSGSDMRLSGTTDRFTAESNSGSDIKAGNLKARICNASASSGSDITLYSSEELTARASSGGDITYYGNPSKVNKKDGVSGSIRKH
ncbi:MAG: DUF2807 domain-containing protein [Flavobacteriaceae bacterium]|nr:DUF2807 domain-containing protein [Flavobacteriaceae bacterium]NNK27891.1 DUF2807 domain-containing protein [Flavobacteriaceae bacterium]RZV65460.1 MAG: DUF2807 domain-containing protein [Flavobacteriaceae bacterium]RZW45850.1 MAG: DUF2807 domain-containing protein [Flavobacteriaceae bacterium]